MLADAPAQTVNKLATLDELNGNFGGGKETEHKNIQSLNDPRFASVKHSCTHPKYLHSNSTRYVNSSILITLLISSFSHVWPFGAIAELIDNACDPDVRATMFHVRYFIFKRKIYAHIFYYRLISSLGMSHDSNLQTMVWAWILLHFIKC